MAINDECIKQTHHKFTRKDAVAWINRSKPGTHFCAHVSLSVAVAGSDDTTTYPSGNRTAIKLTRTEAMALVEAYFSEKREQEGWRVPCCEYRHLAYSPGEAIPADEPAKRDYVCYWIG